MKRNVQVAAIALASAMLACFGARAQAPGGVSPAVWYRADAPGSVFSDAGSTAASNNATVQQWNEARGTGRNLIQATASARPVFSNSSALANFNPTVTFDGSNDFLQFTAGTGVNLIDRANGSIYAAGYVNTLKQSGFAGFHASMDYPGLHIFGSNNKLLFFTGGPGYQGLSASAYTADMFFSAGSGWQNGAGTNASYAAATVSLNGTRTDYNGSQLYNANLSTGARDFRIGADNNYGAFSGQLNEVMVFEDKLTTDQMDRVETYLAVKYGTTYAGGTRDYKSSAGNVVWNASANTGFHNNIAGIGRDDNGALHQKQSWSTNAGRQVLIGTTGLTNTNAGNSLALNAGQYLIWGDNGLAKVPTVSTTAFPSVSHHFQAIWKVQNSGAVGTVRVAWPKGLKSLSLIQSSDQTIGAGDVLTPLTSETTINGVVYNYADVTLADGQYFTFAAKVPAPGGVTTGLTQWYRADEGLVKVGGDGSNVTTWTDFARGTVSGQIATAPVPVYKQGATNYFNFNPGVNFTAIQQMLGNITTQTLENTSFDIFTLTKEGMSGTRYFNIGMNNTSLGGANWDQPGLYASGNMATRNSTGGGAVIVNPGNIAFSTTIPSIMYHTFTNTSIRKGVNGAGLGTQYDVSARGQMTGGHIFGANGGTNPPGGDDWGFTGHIGEVVIYGGGNLTAAERNRVDSYLAIKYGITLPAGVNYLNSNGSVAWDAAANSAYHNNVAGIASDESSALSQKQSISVNKGQQVIISTTGLTDTNAGNGTSLSDGQYLIWGDNGLSKTLSASFNFASVPTLNLRFAAIWKVQNTANVGTVRVAWPSGIPSLTLIQSADATIDDTDARTDMTANSASVNGVSYNYADVTLSDGQYFTFAGFVSGPGNVASAAWYRADAAGQQFSDAGTTVATDGQALQQWNEYKGTGYNLVQASAGNRPTFSNTTTLANFNPTVTFPGSQWMRYTAPTGVNVIDRANGSIYAAGYLNSLKNVGFAGFHSSMDYPGLHTYSVSGNYNLLFFTGGPGYQGLSGNSFVNKNYFTIGSGWQNGEGSTAAYAGATVSLNGNRTVFSGTNQIQNAVINNASRDFQIGQDDNHGALNGQLNEVVVFEQRLTEDEMNRVETYMAIKYGTTYAAGTKDYVNSSSGTVWANATNNGYHFNIAGISRDDMGSLYQKQSWSTNPGRQVLISTTGLDNTNAGNTGVLSNGQYLIWGDNNLAKAPTVSIAGISGVNYRFASIWKAQNTNAVGMVRVAWAKGYANLKLIQSGDATIDASDVITAMENSQVVNGIEYAYADVTIANGQYFTFAAFIQAPGGVTNNLSYWYRADKLVDAAGEDGDVAYWTDFTSGTTVGQINEAPLPKFKNGGATYFNYNPGINFTAIQQMIGNIDVQTLHSLDFDIFKVTKEGAAGSRVFNVGMNNATFNGTNWDQPSLYPNGGVGRRNNTGALITYNAVPGGIAASTTVPSIMYHKFSDVNVSNGLNGAAIGTGTNHTATGAVTGGHIFGANGGVNPPGGDDWGFTGHIGELVVYGHGSVTATERNKVDTYLAIKYGVTLNNTNNYTTSSGVVVWDKDANIAHYNNVAGIGNDFISALHQKQSRSQHANTNDQVIIGLGGIAATNAANTNSLSDGQFLVWGDNGNTQNMTTANTPFVYSGSINNGRRMNRIWKVQNTNVAGETLIRFPQASVGTTTLANDACAGYVILFASDAAFSSNVTAVPVTLNGTDYEATHSFPNGASYFTFGKVTPITTGTVYLPAVTEETTQFVDNCATGEWTYFRKSADASLKLFATSGLPADVLNNLTVKITPEGVTYTDGTKTTSLMPRIASVTNGSATAFTGAKVRIYYSASELTATQLPGAQVNAWFKYEGSAEDVIANVYGSGVLDASKAVQLTPNASGVEDGVNYVEFHNISSLSSFVYLSTTSESAMPVTLTYFKAAKEGGIANLAWATAEEVNNKGFEIQRSADARNWNIIGFVENQTEGGNSKGALSYDFKDASPMTGTNYYRLKQIDLDGTYMYSSAVALRFDVVKGALSVYPNPVVNGRLSLNLPHSGSYKASIYNVAGVEVMQANQSGDSLDIRNLRAGLYVVRIVYANGESHSKTFVVK
ncbi:T9SS type A sorting domain-containing protein [Dyadobacter endophyticus]|nr:T9SS type A sorting domain-containing protein [Dyadobacter endophyticus]